VCISVEFSVGIQQRLFCATFLHTNTVARKVETRLTITEKVRTYI
jgi:hypothetical protein